MSTSKSMTVRVVLALGMLLLGLAQAGCEGSAAASSEPAPASTWFPLRAGEVPIEAQLVLTHAEQTQGLMHRKSLGENRGMLFPYQTPRRMGFWMKNTLIPLDIGFFDADGILREVHALHPRDTRTVHSRGDDLHYALEMNQGWFARHGVRPGAQLDRELLAQAITARGGEPSDFGLNGE